MEGDASSPNSLEEQAEEENSAPRGERKEQPVKKGRTEQPDSRGHLNNSFVFVFESLYLVYPTINKNNSATIRQLGIANISITIVKQKQGFAGRLRLFKSNWDKICSDQWVLQAIWRYHIKWLIALIRGDDHIAPDSLKRRRSL